MTLTVIGFVVLLVGLVGSVLWLKEELKIQEKYYRDVLDLRKKDTDEIMILKAKIKDLEEKASVATEPSVLNNKFIETVKKTAKEQAEASKSRIASLQHRNMR